MKKIRVLVVDDSFFMRAAIKKILVAEARMEVVGEAKDGADAVQKVQALQPDVVTMDFNMPVLDGAGAVREIMRTRPTPVLMLSAHTTEGARETFEALQAGAVDFLAKPSGEVSADFTRIAPELVAKVVAAAEATPAHLPVAARVATARAARTSGPSAVISGAGQPRIVVIAVSTGGPAALGRLLPRLDGDVPFGMVIVQHMPTGFTTALAERLNALCAMRVREAKSGDRPEPGLALIAPGDRHLDVTHDGVLEVIDGPEVNGVRPAADVTMRAAARAWGRRVVGVIMTGMGRDGVEGLREIKKAGGVTLAQERASCVVYGMPKAAIESGVVDRVVPLEEIADALRH
jgi:two-component system, chemotaxis family, protein-glutamate methylesterase/glutaminase